MALAYNTYFYKISQDLDFGLGFTLNILNYRSIYLYAMDNVWATYVQIINQYYIKYMNISLGPNFRHINILFLYITSLLNCYLNEEL